MTLALRLGFVLTQGTRIAGWSETVIVNIADIPTYVLNPAFVTGYMAARANVLGSGVTVNFAQLSQLTPGRPPVSAVRRQVLPIAPPAPSVGSNGSNYYNPYLANNPSDFSQTTLLHRITSPVINGQTYIRSFWLSGIPDSIDLTNVPIPLPGPWYNSYNIWQSYFPGVGQSTPLQIWVNDRSSNNPTFPCTAYNLSANSYTVPGHNISTGQQIEGIGFKAFPGGSVPRGRYKAIVNTDNTISLAGAGTATLIKHLGGFRPVSYIAVNAIGVIPRSYTNKKRGRPFGLLVGRRQTRPTSHV
jgi:hypothetical protein